MNDGKPDNSVPVGAESGAMPTAPATIGQRLRAARESAGLTINQVATTTRVNSRMLESIERDAFDELPIGPYAASFAKSFATAVGLDGVAIGEQVRAVSHERNIGHVPTITHFEPADASRTPSRTLAFGAAAIAGLLVAAYLVWQAVMLRPATEAPPPAETSAPATVATAPSPPAQPTTTAPPIAETAPILISATGQVWFSLEDANGRSQFDLTLGQGEYYTLKPNQRGLFLRTGAPQNIRLLVDGQPLPPLGTTNQLVRGVGLDNASLARRRAGLPMVPPPFAQPAAGQTAAAMPAR